MLPSKWEAYKILKEMQEVLKSDMPKRQSDQIFVLERVREEGKVRCFSPGNSMTREC